jgi:hypothetical protein
VVCPFRKREPVLRLPVVLLASASVLAPLYARGAEAADDSKSEIVVRYLDARRTQQEALKGVQMEASIDAKLPRLEKQGKMRVLRKISRLGKISFRMLGFQGDDTIKQEVIARYLNLESDSTDKQDISVTPDNYKFHLKTSISQAGHRTYVFQVTPKRKAVGLFKGELWLDGETGMPLRESGELVKNPSIFLKKVVFVHDYQLKDGVSIPKHIESTVDTRIAGRAQLEIEFTNFTRSNEDDDPVAETTGGPGN